MIEIVIVFFSILGLAGLSAALLALEARAEKWAQAHPIKEGKSGRMGKISGAR